MSNPWNDWLNESLAEWTRAGLLRSLRPLEAESAVRVRTAGRSLILFSSNDYLGLSMHPEVIEAAARAVRDGGMGPRGSALVCGYTTEHEALEEDLARLKGTETSLLCPTGYAANLAVLTGLAGPGTTLFSDELNHASLIDGCRLAKRLGAEVKVYRHRDTEHLAHLLEDDLSERKAILTDTVFSMDGDLAPLMEISDLKRKTGALLVVDDAHGTLVFGNRGEGVPGWLGLTGEVDIQVGTLSKAAGSMGGFVACSRPWKDWLLNRGRSYVFSTALPLPVVAAARKAVEVASRESTLRDSLWSRVEQLASALEIPSDSPIVPLVIGGNEETLEASRALWEAGFHVPGIRPPTVPEGTSRLRVALSAAHAEEDVYGLAEALSRLPAGRVWKPLNGQGHQTPRAWG